MPAANWHRNGEAIQVGSGFQWLLKQLLGDWRGPVTGTSQSVSEFGSRLNRGLAREKVEVRRSCPGTESRATVPKPPRIFEIADAKGPTRLAAASDSHHAAIGGYRKDLISRIINQHNIERVRGSRYLTKPRQSQQAMTAWGEGALRPVSHCRDGHETKAHSPPGLLVAELINRQRTKTGTKDLAPPGGSWRRMAFIPVPQMGQVSLYCQVTTQTEAANPWHFLPLDSTNAAESSRSRPEQISSPSVSWLSLSACFVDREGEKRLARGCTATGLRGWYVTTFLRYETWMRDGVARPPHQGRGAELATILSLDPAADWPNMTAHDRRALQRFILEDGFSGQQKHHLTEPCPTIGYPPARALPSGSCGLFDLC